jgi:death on curing protein
VTKRKRRWVKESVVLAIHDEQLAEHGGLAGIRDSALLSSALARPQNLDAYGKPDLADLAAAYAVGICRNHPFLDGNKRTALVVALVFIQKNRHIVRPDQRDAVEAMLALADGTLSESKLGQWFRGYLRLLPPA